MSMVDDEPGLPPAEWRARRLAALRKRIQKETPRPAKLKRWHPPKSGQSAHNTTQLNLRVPRWLYNALRANAELECKTLNFVCIGLLEKIADQAKGESKSCP